MPDGHIVCTGGHDDGDPLLTAEKWGPPVQGGENTAWTWRALPPMSVGQSDRGGCRMSDGLFAVLGGIGNAIVSSCEALGGGVNADEYWEALSPMHDSRNGFACAAVAGCVIVAGGEGDVIRNLRKCTTRSSVGGCGFHVTCHTWAGWRGWATRFCSQLRSAHVYSRIMELVYSCQSMIKPDHCKQKLQNQVAGNILCCIRGVLTVRVSRAVDKKEKQRTPFCVH